MRNSFKIFALILGLSACGWAFKPTEAKAERQMLSQTVLRLDAEKTQVGEYAYTDEKGNSGTLTLYSDMTCSISVPSLGFEGECTYSLEGDICTLTADGKSVMVKLNSDGTFEPVPEGYGKACSVSVAKAEHGSVEVDAWYGDVGDVVTVTATHDLLYKVDYVSVNGTKLVEDAEVRGKYTFALAEGENVITASFVVDKEVCGELSGVVAKASDGDWADVFTLENALLAVKWIIDGGLLLAMVRYFIKDKRLESKVEKATEDSLNKFIPTSVRDTVVTEMGNIVTPVVQDNAVIKSAMGILMKGMVLMQQGTPEAKVALLAEFEKMKSMVDPEFVEGIKKYIEDALAQREKNYGETMTSLDEITERHEEEITSEPAETPSDDGTQI